MKSEGGVMLRSLNSFVPSTVNFVIKIEHEFDMVSLQEAIPSKSTVEKGRTMYLLGLTLELLETKKFLPCILLRGWNTKSVVGSLGSKE